MVQLPLFFLSFALTGYNLRYVTPVSRSIRDEIGKTHNHTGKGQDPEGSSQKDRLWWYRYDPRMGTWIF